MAKKIWLLISIIAALAASELLFQGGVLLIKYQERRQGIFLLGAGAAMFLLFGWSFFQGTKKRGAQERAGIGEMIISAEFLGVAAAGIILYRTRYCGTVTIVTALSVFLIIYACAAALFIWLLNRHRI